MAITPFLCLDPEQLTRFRGFFSDRGGDREYVYYPNALPYQKVISVIHFLYIFKKFLEHYLGPDSIENISLKGGAARYIFTGNVTLLPDIDLEIHLKAIEHLGPLSSKEVWHQVSHAFYEALAQVTDLPQIRSNHDNPAWTNTRKLVQDREKQVAFSVHGVPAYRQGRKQSIDLCVAYIRKKVPLASSSLTSADALHIDLTDYISQRQLQIIPVCTVDGYDPCCSMQLLKKRQCTVRPTERIRLLFRGSFAYCHNLTKGCYPDSPAIDEEFLQNLHEQFTQNELNRYLDLHYRDNPEGRVIYLLNCYGLAKRYRKVSKDHKDHMIQEIFRCLKHELGGHTAPHAIAEMWQFFRYASGYIYLRSKNTIAAENWPAGYFLSDAPNAAVNVPHLFASITPELFQELKTPCESILSHPLMAALVNLFPHTHENLQTFFQQKIKERMPEEGEPEPLRAQTPELTPPPTLAPIPEPKPEPTLEDHLIRWKTMRPKQVFQETTQKTDWAKAYLQTRPENISPEETLAFWGAFGFHLFIREDQTLDGELLQFLLKKLPKKEWPRVYDIISKTILISPDETFRSLFPLFFKELYPSQAKLLKSGLERWMCLEGGPFPEVLEQLARHVESLKSDVLLKKWFLAQSVQIFDSTLIQNAVRQLNAKPKVAKAPVEPTAKMPAIFSEFEHLVKQPRVDLENLHLVFNTILMTESLQAFWPRLNRLIEQKELPPALRTQMGLFGLHLLTHMDPPDVNQIERVLMSELDQNILDFKILDRQNPFIKNVILRAPCTLPPYKLSYFEYLLIRLFETTQEPVVVHLIEKILKKKIAPIEKINFAHKAIAMAGLFNKKEALNQGYFVFEKILTLLTEQGSNAALSLFESDLKELSLKAQMIQDPSFLVLAKEKTEKIQNQITLTKDKKTAHAHDIITKMATNLPSVLQIEEDQKFLEQLKAFSDQLDHLPVLLNLSPIYDVFLKPLVKKLSDSKRRNLIPFSLKVLALSPGDTLMEEFEKYFNSALVNKSLRAEDLSLSILSFSLEEPGPKSLWALILRKSVLSKDKLLIENALSFFKRTFKPIAYAEALMTIIRESNETLDISITIEVLYRLGCLLERLEISIAEQNRFLNLILQVAQISLKFPEDPSQRENLFLCYTRFMQNYPPRLKPKQLTREQFFAPKYLS